MVKRSLVLLVGLVLAALPASAARITATPSAQDVEPGAMVTVDTTLELGSTSDPAFPGGVENAGDLSLTIELMGGGVLTIGPVGSGWPSNVVNTQGNRALFSLTADPFTPNQGSTPIAPLTVDTTGVAPGTMLELVVASVDGNAAFDTPPFFAALDLASSVGSTISTINVVPEPATAILMGLGLGSLAIYGRRRTRPE